MHPLLASIPIVALVAAMTVRLPRAGLPLPASRALPGAALLALGLQALSGADATPAWLGARVVEGLLTALMPLAIVFGAVLLFRALEASGAMRSITAHLERAVPDAVLRVVLIAWAFSYLVEGLSGFGTPAALAAPLLVGLGFPAVRAAAACLVMNTVPVVFGAVGTPVWFGLGALELTAGELRDVGRAAAVLQCLGAPVVVALALRVLFPWREVRARWAPVGAVVLATVAASSATAWFSVEFPTIAGGVCGIAAALVAGRVLARRGGAPTRDGARERAAPPVVMPLWRAAAPIAATVLLLAVTRLEPLGLRGLLTAGAPAATLDLGAAGVLSVSPALVVGLRGILGTGASWSMAVLYVPFIVPFVLVVAATAPLLGLSARRVGEVAGGAARSLGGPAVALCGALVFVKLMMHGGAQSPVTAVGRALAEGASAVHPSLWLPTAPLLGALGAFFSGSATVSNLTFAPVQAEVAQRLGLDVPRVLALQTIGGAMGNMVCIHNIVAVAAVLGLARPRAPQRVGTTPAPGVTRDGGEDPVATILRLNALPLAAFAAAAGAGAVVLALIGR